MKKRTFIAAAVASMMASCQPVMAFTVANDVSVWEFASTFDEPEPYRKVNAWMARDLFVRCLAQKQRPAYVVDFRVWEMPSVVPYHIAHHQIALVPAESPLTKESLLEWLRSNRIEVDQAVLQKQMGWNA